MKRNSVRGQLRHHSLVAEIDGKDVRQQLAYSTKTLLPLTQISNAPHLLELFELCLALYAADRLIKRPPQSWGREIEVAFPFSKVGRWIDSRRLVEQLFYQTTGDKVILLPQERQAGETHADSRTQVFQLEHPERPSVALLSDGLDSLCGALQALEERDGTIAFVSLITNPARQARINTIRAWIEQNYRGRVAFHQVGFHLLRPPKAQEQTQRFRTILAIAAGLTVCSAYGAEALTISENGIGILNLPVPNFQTQHESSQVLHPSNLELWQLVSSRTSGGARIDYPNRFRTKAEMCIRLPARARELIKVTSSCDSPQRIDNISDCGVCGSCQIRQVALRTAGLSSYDKAYLQEPRFSMRFEPRQILRYHARVLEECMRGGDWASLARLQPTLATSVDMPTASERAHVISTTLDLLRRHTAEVLGDAA